MVVLGQVGTGAWGTNWVRTLAQCPHVDYRYICDLDSGRLARVARLHPALCATTRYDEMLRDPQVDGIVIATSAPTHYELARLALLAGKHVLVEKPLALSAQDARLLVQLGQEQDRIVMVGHLLEYHPAVAYIRKMIAKGELGEVHYGYSQRLNLGSIRRDENAWWSLAPHDISLACRLFGGSPTSVQCRGQAVVQPKVVDVAFATLEFPSRRLAHVHVSWLDPHKTRRLTVVGSRRMVVFDDTEPGYKITVYDKGFEVTAEFGTYAEWISLRQGDVVMPRIDPTEPLMEEARHFVECIETSRTPMTDGRAGVEVVEVLEAGQRSMLEGGSVVRLGSQIEPAHSLRLVA